MEPAHDAAPYEPSDLVQFLHGVPRAFGDAEFTMLDGYGVWHALGGWIAFSS